MKTSVSLLTCFLVVGANCFAQHQDHFPDPDTTIQRKLEEWKDLKFGLLMHWGPYSQWGVVESWSICPEDLSWASGARKKGVADDYNSYVRANENLQTTFNPTHFNPEKWADAAKEVDIPAALRGVTDYVWVIKVLE